MKKHAVTPMLLAAGLVALSACTTLPPAPTAADTQVAGIALAINRAEVEAGELGRTRATSPAVRDFATMLAEHHGDAVRQEESWASTMEVSAAETEASRALRQNAQQSLAALRQYEGAAFDRRFMEHQLATHRWVLNTIDQALLPNAVEEGLRTHLQEVRGSVQQHIAEAERVLGGLPRS